MYLLNVSKNHNSSTLTLMHLKLYTLEFGIGYSEQTFGAHLAPALLAAPVAVRSWDGTSCVALAYRGGPDTYKQTNTSWLLTDGRGDNYTHISHKYSRSFLLQSVSVR